jgi:hypothetical protein
MVDVWLLVLLGVLLGDRCPSVDGGDVSALLQIWGKPWAWVEDRKSNSLLSSKKCLAVTLDVINSSVCCRLLSPVCVDDRQTNSLVRSTKCLSASFDEK